MRRVSRLVVAVLIASAAVAGALVLDSGSPGTEQALSTAASSGTVQEFDSTTFVVTTYANGTATFTIRYERRLANDSEVDQFETFAQRFENQSTDLYTGFQSRADALTSTGQNATGREMTATNFQRSAEVQERFNTLGVVEMSFQWSNFAVVRDDDTVAVGDVFEGGIYLGPNQALVFRHGPDVRFDSVDPEGSTSGDTLTGSDSVTWTGEREFGDNRPRAIYQPADQVATTTTGGAGDGGDGGDGSTTGDAGPGTDQAGDGDGLGMLPMLALALVAVLVAAFAYRTYGDDLVTTSDEGGTGPGAGTAGSSGGDGGSGASTGDAPTAGAATDSTSSEPAVSDEELLTDEDRVRQLLEDHGGRMRQVNIVDQTGWSKSKVSMLLSDMEDDGYISKLRVGRENIVSLDGHEPDVAGSPFDDENDDT